MDKKLKNLALFKKDPFFFDIDGACTASSTAEQSILRGGFGVIGLTTGGAAGSGCHIDTGNTNQFRATSSPWMHIRLAPINATTTQSVVVGFAKLAQNATTGTSTTAGVYLMYSPDMGVGGGGSSASTSWNFVTRANASQASTTTLPIEFAPTQGVWQDIFIDFSSSTARVIINGKQSFIRTGAGTFIPLTQVEPELHIDRWRAGVGSTIVPTWQVDYWNFGMDRPYGWAN